MKSRYVVLFLAVVLALALAVPALGGPTNPLSSISASVKQTANKALKQSKKALQKAKTAQSTAEAAQSSANSANTAAKNAQTTATAAAAAAKNAQTTADAANTAAKNAQGSADAAKAAADAAQATANKKLGETFSEFGEFTAGTTSAASVVNCPTGSEVTGGGFTTSGAGTNEIVPTFNSSYGDAWAVSMERIPGGSKTWSVQAVVVCAKP